MNNFCYNITISTLDEEENNVILYNDDGYIIPNSEEDMYNKIQYILDDAFRIVRLNFGIDSKDIILSNAVSMYKIIDSIDKYYDIKFDIVNLNYDKNKDLLKTTDKCFIITDLYKVTPLLDKFILNRYVLFNNEQEMQLELSDYNDSSGLLFDRGDKVKIIKDFTNTEYIVVGKAGHVRGPQQANLYCVKNLITDDEIDMIHESDLILSE